jgi:hypothetical protein
MSVNDNVTFQKKEYKCEKCNKLYSSRNSLWNHNNKFHKPLSSDQLQIAPNSSVQLQIAPKENENNNLLLPTQCKYCKKIFAKVSNLTRHYKICKHKINMEETTELKQEIHELKNTMNEILKTIKIHPKTLEKINKQLNNCNNTTNNTINNTNSNNTINNIINNNITLVKFGEENLEKTLTKKEKIKILENMYYSLEESIKLTHFNKKHPEMNNICITNLRDEIGYVYNGGNQFEAIPKMEIYTQLIHKHIEHIELSMNTYKEYLSDYKIKRLKCFIEQIENKEKEYNHRNEKKYKTYEHYQREKIKILIFNESNKNKKIFNAIYKELQKLQ